jgi:hypothetical protein
VRETTSRTEGMVGLIKDAIHSGKGFACGGDELFA